MCAVTPLLTLLCVYWAALLSMKLNIGHRHALATYPPMFILAGGAGAWLSRGTRLHIAGTVAVVVMLCAMAVGALVTWPDYLAYITPLAGGPRNGYKLLVDSSMDWGQDLPGLKRWLEGNGSVRPGEASPSTGGGGVYLAYFGKGSPDYYGIAAESLSAKPGRRGTGVLPVAGGNGQDARSTTGGDTGVPPVADTLTGGVYCVSATMLQAVPIVPMGKWCRFYEQDYQRLLASDEARRGEHDLWLQLRFGRLAAYLRQREPDDNVGHSILIYRLSDDDVRAALSGPPAELFDTHGVKGAD